jgi:hypothetical protein
MKKRIGIAILVLGVFALFAILIAPRKTSPPPASPAPQPVSETAPAVAPASQPAPEAVPTNPPAAPAAPAPVVETNPPEPTPPLAAPTAPAPENNSVSIPPDNSTPTAVANSTPPAKKNSCSFIRNLLTGSFTNNLTDNQEFFYRVRAGYERAQYGNTESTWLLAAKFYYRPQSWRDELKGSTNFFMSLLVPDTLGVIDHSAIELVPDSGKPTAQEGVHAGIGFFWPWLNWRSKASDDCPDGAIQFSLGPTINGGVEETSSGSDPDLNWYRYGGLRLAASPDAFVEFTIGRNGDLPGVRQQVLGEIPIYRNHNSDFRYVLRGLWNAPTSGGNGKSIFEAAILVEFPFEALEHPSKFINLIPFTN